MRIVAAVGALILVGAQAVNAELAETKLYNLVDTPAAIIYNASGQAQVALEPGGIINVTGYRKVSFQIAGAKATRFGLVMGKMSNATLAHEYTGTIDDRIHTYDVVGPQMALRLSGGPANAHDNVQVWVYLST